MVKARATDFMWTSGERSAPNKVQDDIPVSPPKLTPTPIPDPEPVPAPEPEDDTRAVKRPSATDEPQGSHVTDEPAQGDDPHEDTTTSVEGAEEPPPELPVKRLGIIFAIALVVVVSLLSLAAHKFYIVGLASFFCSGYAVWYLYPALKLRDKTMTGRQRVLYLKRAGLLFITAALTWMIMVWTM